MNSTIKTNSGQAIKLVHIITGLRVGGAERMLHKLLTEMDRQTFDNTVISLTEKGPVAEDIESLGIRVYALNMKRGIPNPLGFIKLIYRLKKIKPDIVQTWMYHADLLGGLAAKMVTHSPLVWNIRHSNLDKKINKWTTRLVAKISAWVSGAIPDKIICNSQRAIDIHQRMGYQADKLKFIGNGFDLDEFKPDKAAKPRLKAALSLPADTILIGLMARYDPQKDHANFIQAAQTLLFNQPKSHFILAGHGIDDSNQELLDLITQTGFKNHFHLLGVRKDMPSLVAALDILCLSSSAGEGFPNTVGEAMACAVPCVVTDVGDSAQLVAETGKVVSTQDSRALATALLELLSLSEEQRLGLGEQARQRIAANYSIAGITRQYQDFYKNLLTA